MLALKGAAVRVVRVVWAALAVAAVPAVALPERAVAVL